MSIAKILLELLSGISLFLFGMQLMGDGLKKVAGNKLEVVLYKLTDSSWKGILLGTAVTAIIQSSSATSVMVVGFVNAKMMKLKQAIGIVLGAILGTSITGWILCLAYVGNGGKGSSGIVSLISASTLTAVVAVAGIVIRMTSKKQTWIWIADIMLGFAVLMFGLSVMSGSVEPLKENATFTGLLTRFSDSPFLPLLGILVGTVFTSILQSASATVGILQSLAFTGVIDFRTAFPLILGIAIGASVPVLLSAVGANISAKRTAFIYLIIDVIGVVLCGALFYILNLALQFEFMTSSMTVTSVAALNTAFRFATVILLAPFIGLLEKLICHMIPDKKGETEKGQAVERLEERFLAHPAIALDQCREVVNAMALEAEENLRLALGLLDGYAVQKFEEVLKMEATVDRYEDKLGNYLIKVTGRELTERQNRDATRYLNTISDFERISDHAENVALAAKEKDEKKLNFSKEATEELKVMRAAVSEIVKVTINAFVHDDVSLAVRVEPLEQVIDDLCDEMKLRHTERLQKGICTLNQGFIFNDLLTDLERVSDHCSNIAISVIELKSEVFDPHEYAHMVKDGGKENFEKIFDEYSGIFRI